MKRFIPDLGFIFLAACVALFLVGKPPQAKHQMQKGASRSIAVPSAEVSALQRQVRGDNRQMPEGDLVAKRNIFSETGNYKDAGTAVKAIIPENPYELIGIVCEVEKKALFREYSGNVAKAGKGHKMLDGFLVKTIEDRRVILARGKEKREYRLFGTAEPMVTGGKKHKDAPGQSPVLIGILGGDVRRALFREQNGVLMTMAVNDSLPDGSVITRIDPQMIGVRKGKKDVTLTPQIAGHPSPHVREIKGGISENGAANVAGSNPDRRIRPPRRPGPARAEGKITRQE